MLDDDTFNSFDGLTMHRVAFIIGLMAVMPLGLTGCGHTKAAEDRERSEQQAAARATVSQPARKPLVRTVELPGRVEAFEVAPLHARVTGYVVKIPVDIGDQVRGPHEDEPGAALCELLVPELQEELAEKAAAVEQVQAEVKQADAAVKVAEAVVRSAEARVQEAQSAVARAEASFARWQSEFQRIAQLAERGAVTQKVADEARSEFDSADAGRQEVAARVLSVQALQQEAEAGLEKAAADATAMRAQLAVAEAKHRRVSAMVDFSIVRAPFDGVVVERNVSTGHLAQAGGGAANRPVLTIMRSDPVRVFTDVPEGDAVYVNPGTKVEVAIPAVPGLAYTGTVTRTGWSLNNTSRTLLTEIDIPNPDGKWRPGLYVQVKLTVAELTDVLSLPKTAIIMQDKQPGCLCVQPDGQVVRRPVALGLQAGGDVEIRSGLTGDEQVITVNANTFREGQIVEVTAPAGGSR